MQRHLKLHAQRNLNVATHVDVKNAFGILIFIRLGIEYKILCNQCTKC